MLTVHHLHRSQSERIVWLCEELELPYELKTYPRDPKTFASPPELAKLHPMGSAPVIQDSDITLAESGAVAEYIITKYANGRLTVPPSSPAYSEYLYYLHYANATLQPLMTRISLVKAADIPAEHPMAQYLKRNHERGFKLLNDRLEANKWLAGEEFTVADIMTVFSLSTMRLFCPVGLEEYPAIVRWLGDVGKRPAYQKAMQKGDPGFEPLLGAEKPEGVTRKGS